MLRKTLKGFAFATAWAVFGCSSSAGELGSKAPAPAETSVLDACLDFAARLCADAAGCCQAVYNAFEQEACVATFRREVCRPSADAVQAGRATFDAGAVEGCLLAHAEAHRVCVPNWAETLELNRAIYQACRVIDGTTEPGRGCTTAVTCKRPEGTGTAVCNKNLCQVVELLPEGAECEFPSGDVSVCDAGLTCDTPGIGIIGVCVKAVLPGQACDASVLESTQCGLGSYCDVKTSSCKLAENYGDVGCAQSTECISFECDRIGNQCRAAAAVVSAVTCSGL